jgi:CPA2 family monovalent cation:H+ antiporter-2
MTDSALAQILILLTAGVVVIAAVRRLKLPPILGFLAVGMILGPHALDLAVDTEAIHVLGEYGVVFLVFTLGLEFSFPRMVAMKWEVLGLGAGQVVLSMLWFGGIAWLTRLDIADSLVIGGALAMSSTAIIVRQLIDQAEVNRTHGRLSIGILLGQDLAFVPLLAIVSALQTHTAFELAPVISAALKAAAALVVVLAAGRWLLRPLFQEIARLRSQELFLLAVLLVALGSAWATSAAGLSLALGAFLAGMMLAETEYRHQIESVIRPFRDILLGLFFIAVGSLLDIALLARSALKVLLLLLGLLLAKAVIVTLITRVTAGNWFRSLRTGIVIAAGGEFGFALLTLLLQGGIVPADVVQPLLAAIVLSMVVSPLLIRHNKQIARLVLGEKGKPDTAVARQALQDQSIAGREHVVICGFGRVGQSIARVLERMGFEYIAMDLDPRRVSAARQAGDPVLYGDAADENMLESAGLEHASVVVISFSDTDYAERIVRSIRERRTDVPVLVRTQDDSKLERLQKLGATEVIPETLEASLMLVSHVLLLLDIPVSRVVKTVGDIRDHRYSMLRNLFRRGDPRALDETHAFREELQTVVLSPGAWAVGRTIADVKARGAEVSVSALRRDGIVGREPSADTELREGDVLVIYGTPEALEHAETVLLMG